MPAFSVDDVRLLSSDRTSLAATVFTPEEDGRSNDSSSSLGSHVFRGHAMVMVHAHPKFGGSPEMMHGKETERGGEGMGPHAHTHGHTQMVGLDPQPDHKYNNTICFAKTEEMLLRVHD